MARHQSKPKLKQLTKRMLQSINATFGDKAPTAAEFLRVCRDKATPLFGTSEFIKSAQQLIRDTAQEFTMFTPAEAKRIQRHAWDSLNAYHGNMLARADKVLRKEAAALNKLSLSEAKQIALSATKTVENGLRADRAQEARRFGVAPEAFRLNEGPGGSREQYQSWWNLYQFYLNSPQWLRFRKRIVIERGSRCEKCFSTCGILHVHHLTYERVCMERETDVVVLCVPCHEKAHGRKLAK